MHQRMQAQLAEKLARDAAESSEKEEKVDLRGRIVKPRIDAWTQGKKVYIITHSHCAFVREPDNAYNTDRFPYVSWTKIR